MHKRSLDLQCFTSTARQKANQVPPNSATIRGRHRSNVARHKNSCAVQFSSIHHVSESKPSAGSSFRLGNIPGVQNAVSVLKQASVAAWNIVKSSQVGLLTAAVVIPVASGARQVVDHRVFQSFVLWVIIMNTVIMAMEFHDMPEALGTRLEQLNFLSLIHI